MGGVRGRATLVVGAASTLLLSLALTGCIVQHSPEAEGTRQLRDQIAESVDRLDWLVSERGFTDQALTELLAHGINDLRPTEADPAVQNAGSGAYEATADATHVTLSLFAQGHGTTAGLGNRVVLYSLCYTLTATPFVNPHDPDDLSKIAFAIVDCPAWLVERYRTDLHEEVTAEQLDYEHVDPVPYRPIDEFCQPQC